MISKKEGDFPISLYVNITLRAFHFTCFASFTLRVMNAKNDQQNCTLTQYRRAKSFQSWYMLILAICFRGLSLHHGITKSILNAAPPPRNIELFATYLSIKMNRKWHYSLTVEYRYIDAMGFALIRLSLLLGAVYSPFLYLCFSLRELF